MWKRIMDQIISAVITTALIAVAVTAWGGVTSGGLIKVLGGITQADIADHVTPAAPADLKVVSLVTAQHTPPPVLDCGNGWKPTSARFYESYRDGRTQKEKHFLICMKAD